MARRRCVIAIDGPAGAGKSTVARAVAQELGYTYIDSGAMYRALTLAVLRAGVAPDDAEAVARVAEKVEVTLSPGETGNRVYLDGVDVTEAIRDPETSAAVSYVAAIPEVRRRLVAMQQQLARRGGVVMDGRDIGTIVLPGADLKVFLNASVEERARRRWEEMRASGREQQLAAIRANIEQRDSIDSARAVAPLRKADDAVEIDTTTKTVSEVVEEVLRLARAKEGASCTE